MSGTRSCSPSRAWSRTCCAPSSAATDFSTLRKLSSEYVSDEHAQNATATSLWRLRVGGGWAYLLVLLEFQSARRSLQVSERAARRGWRGRRTPSCGVCSSIGCGVRLRLPAGGSTKSSSSIGPGDAGVQRGVGLPDPDEVAAQRGPPETPDARLHPDGRSKRAAHRGLGSVVSTAGNGFDAMTARPQDRRAALRDYQSCTLHILPMSPITAPPATSCSSLSLSLLAGGRTRCAVVALSS